MGVGGKGKSHAKIEKILVRKISKKGEEAEDSMSEMATRKKRSTNQRGTYGMKSLEI